MNIFLSLVLTLPTENATLRQRLWRSLKSSGAAVLRDGVYLMPEQESCLITLEKLATEVIEGGGNAHVLRVIEHEGANFAELFNRSDEYAALMAEVSEYKLKLSSTTVQEVLRQARKLRKTFINIVKTDFFPDQAQKQAESSLKNLEQDCEEILSPGEPRLNEGNIQRLNPNDYQSRVWATRSRPWVDRLASAWLIQRFIDKQASFLWLVSPSDCPADALGFDFDGATFSHVGSKVTFEVLAESFGLSEQAAIVRLGLLVHYLDVGGVQPVEAIGIESLLKGMLVNFQQDDQLIKVTSTVFDALFASFNKGFATND